MTDIGGIIRRRGKLAAFVALVVTLVAYWVAMALPNEYKSYATVLVEPQSVDPDLVEAGVANTKLEERLNLMTTRILARSRLSKIIDDLHLYKDESKHMVREAIIDKMREMVSVEPVVPELVQRQRRGGEYELNTFRINFRDKNAKTAMEVAQRLANDFIESHIEDRVTVSQKSLDFIQGELDRLSGRLHEVEGQIAKVKADNPGRLPEDMLANQRRYERLMTDMAIAQRSLAEASSDEAFYRSQSAAAASMAGPNDDVSPARRIQSLELQLAEYAAKGFTEKHPDVIKARAEIAKVKAQLEEGGADEAADPNAGSESFAAQSIDAEAHRAALRRKAATDEVKRLQGAAAEVSALLAATPAVAEQLDGLDREYRHLSSSYQDFSNRRLEATVQAQLERRQLGEQFRVLEAAFVAPEPTSPDRPMMIVLGVVFGIALGGGLALLRELTDSSVHDARQLQAGLRIPVLGAIPRIDLEVDRVARRRTLIRQALATGFLVIFALVGGFANYAWVNGVGWLTAAEKPAATAPAPEGEAPAGQQLPPPLIPPAEEG